MSLPISTELVLKSPMYACNVRVQYVHMYACLIMELVSTQINFQVILATNGYESFAIFVYDILIMGEFKAGFDAGRRRGGVSLMFRNLTSSEVSNDSFLSNFVSPDGTYAFRIDGEFSMLTVFDEWRKNWHRQFLYN